MTLRIEAAEPRLRELLAVGRVALDDGPTAVLPVFAAFCEEPAITNSDMILWEVGEFGDWVETRGGDWQETDPLWVFSVCRQFERDDEASASDDDPAGFFQLRCAWYYAVGTSSSEFAEWWDDDSMARFFQRIAASPELAATIERPVVRSELTGEWV